MAEEDRPVDDELSLPALPASAPPPFDPPEAALPWEQGSTEPPPRLVVLLVGCLSTVAAVVGQIIAGADAEAVGMTWAVGLGLLSVAWAIAVSRGR